MNTSSITQELAEKAETQGTCIFVDLIGTQVVFFLVVPIYFKHISPLVFKEINSNNTFANCGVKWYQSQSLLERCFMSLSLLMLRSGLQSLYH